MSYTLIPNTGQSLGVTRDPIRTNFSLIQSVYDVNHVDFNAVDAGSHKRIDFIATTNPTLPGTVISALYSTSSKGLLYKTTTAGVNFNIVQDIVPINSQNGMSQLPGRLLIQWGLGTTAANGSVAITFPTAFTSGSVTEPHSIQITNKSSNATTFRASSPSLTGFTAVGTVAAASTFYWVAIGPLT